jgi:hypothetical protein
MTEETPSRSGSKIVIAAVALGLAVGGYAVATGAGGSTPDTSPAVTIPAYDAAADRTPGSYDRDGHRGKCKKDGTGGGTGQSAPSADTSPSDAAAEI